MDTFEIGALAEEIAFNEELMSVPARFAKMVRKVSNQRSLGYDIESVGTDGSLPIFKAIEVKTWHRDGNFFISANELFVLKNLGLSGWIYLVDITSKKVVKKVQDPINSGLISFQPSVYKAFF